MKRRCFPFYLAAILLTFVYLFLLKAGYLTGPSVPVISNPKFNGGNGQHEENTNDAIQTSPLSASATKISPGGSTLASVPPQSAPISPAQNVSKVIVVAKTKDQDTEWVDGELPE